MGIMRGGYHFALPNKSSGATQANFFAANGGGWSADGEHRVTFCAGPVESDPIFFGLGRTLPGAVDMECEEFSGTLKCIQY